MSYVESLPQTSSVIVIVDTAVRDISPLNLVDALRMLHPRLQIIVVLSSDDARLTQRAMLAGACSAVYDTCNRQDLETVITKVVNSSLFSRNGLSAVRSTEVEEKGTALAIVSARGGSGKSYLASLLSATLSRVRKRTLLLDTDIQFSDLGLLFSKSEPLDIDTARKLHTLDAPSLHGLAYVVGEDFSLLRFSATPEYSDTLGAQAVLCIQACRQAYEAVVINTGGFWTLFHSAILESCGCIVVTCDHSLVGIKATQQLFSHFKHLHIPLAQVLVVVNRYQRRGIPLPDIEAALGVSQVAVLGTFPPDACTLIESGQPLRALDEFDEIEESCMVIAERIAMMTGLPLHGCRELDARIQHVGLLQRIFGF